MPRTPPAIARRLDRLARRAHAFHRHAHHPLCGEYSTEVFRLGRRARVCRGCTLACTGVLAGAALGSFLPGAPLVALAAVPLAVSTAAVARGARKIATRFFPAALLAFAAAAGIRTAGAAGAAACVASLAVAALLVRSYRRRGPDRTPCLLCPERSQEMPCRGFAPIVKRERAFQRSSRGSSPG